jgi:2-polyprenyl-3-methyl-5-hydroxy-6-metoxy-1,4-benzoquinol methylase
MPDSRPTFRDPAGSLVISGEHAVRTIHFAFRSDTLEFLQTAFYRRLQARGDMVQTLAEDGENGLRLLHPRIGVPTYPWEWTQSQWLAAAELTLTLCEEALDDGWILKDATPLNILFVGAKPVLVDALSFERRQVGASLWLAYGQYVRTFLLPLITKQMLGWPLALTLFRRDGYEPTELFALLNWPQRLSRTALWPISLPAWLEKRQREPARGIQAAKVVEEDRALHLLRRTLTDLRRRTQRAASERAVSKWSEYQATLSHYTPDQTGQKRAWVQQVLNETQPKRLLDIGANTGEYSVLAASMGVDVVALERDSGAAEGLFRKTQGSGLSILTVKGDIARPTPSAGWENSESSALLERLEGKFEMVMMLAVIHHLLLLEQIPLPLIISLCSRLTTGFLLVEWVPVSDPMFQSLMRGRDDLYGALNESDLLAACKGAFTPVKRELLENGRILFLFRKEQS